MKEIRIHGGGNIGLGLMADIINRSKEPYQIIATSNDEFFNLLINANHQFRLQHDGSADDGDDTLIQNVTMIPRDHSDIVKLYTDATELLAICLTREAFHECVEYIARGIVARYEHNNTKLTILVLMNLPRCDEYVKRTIHEQMQLLIQDPEKLEKILESMVFIPTVSDRIVSKIPADSVRDELKHQLATCIAPLFADKASELPAAIEGIMLSPTHLSEYIKRYSLSCKLFNAEVPFRLYAPQRFLEAFSHFCAIDGVDDLEQHADIKDKYINGPHAILAWLGAILGCQTIAEAMNYPGMGHYIQCLMDKEIAPMLKVIYPTLTTATLISIQKMFLDRCLISTNDPVIRVGRDPLRKLGCDGRILGLRFQNSATTMPTPLLERGVAAGVLYALKDKDSSNPDCQLMKEIYTSNASYTDVLCYQGETRSGIHKGLDLNTDNDLLSRVLLKIESLEKETASLNGAFIQRSVQFFATRGNMLNNALKAMGINVDLITGHLFYTSHFKLIPLDFELVFVRHGETYGNAGLATTDGTIDVEAVRLNRKNHENRIFQGNVDTPINQLTEYGKMQAIQVSEKLETDCLNIGWIPDVIFHSPLQRAKDTGTPFVERHKFNDRYIELPSITEMSFGALENRRVSDIASEDDIHKFYLEQNALVKRGGDDVHGVWRDAENFCQVLLRAKHTLIAMNEQLKGKKVLMFSHSMFGAACCILMGKGCLIENGNYLAFDGKRSNGSYYTMPHATPFLLNASQDCLHQQLGDIVPADVRL